MIFKYARLEIFPCVLNIINDSGTLKRIKLNPRILIEFIPLSTEMEIAVRINPIRTKIANHSFLGE